jgi:hypothetical protein
MIIRLIAIAAVTMTISACAAEMAETDGYVYPDGLPPSGLAKSPSVPMEQDLATTTRALANVGIFENRTSASPGIWLFPPDALGGDN